MNKLCDDCPPVGYETDLTRCTPCPRRSGSNVVAMPNKDSIPRLRCTGIGRDADHDKCLVVYFNRPVTYDEMRFFHECSRRTASLMPTDKEFRT